LVSKIVPRSEYERVPRLSPDDRWDRFQPPHDPTDGLSGYRKWKNGWMDLSFTEIARYDSGFFSSDSVSLGQFLQYTLIYSECGSFK